MWIENVNRKIITAIYALDVIRFETRGCKRPSVGLFTMQSSGDLNRSQNPLAL